MNDVRSQDFKTGKILVPLKEFNILEGTLSYEINGIAEKEVTYFYRQEYKSFKPMPKGEYSLVTSGDNVTITLKTNVYQDGYREIQVCETINLKSSKYEPSGDVDINTVLAYLNNVSEDMANVFRYVKAINTIMDTSSGSNTLSKLTPNTTWYMDNDGIISSLPVKELFDGFNAMVEQVRLKVLEMLRNDLTQAEIELLRRVKTELDTYVENDLKTRLDDYTTALEKRLQVMVDQAVGDKGLMPNNSDWFEVELGNWLIVDLFNKNYLHYPPNLNSDDNNGVFKKDITDNGRTQVIRYYTTTGKLFFVVKVNDVWSEWQEVGGNAGSMQFTQANHGFIFTPVTLDGATKQWKKATRYTGADGIAVMVDNDKFDLVLRGVVNIPTSARDDKGQPFIYDEYYFLSQDVDGGFSKDKNLVGLFQNLIHVSELDGKQVAYVNIGDPVNLDYEVLDSESANRIGIATTKDLEDKLDKSTYQGNAQELKVEIDKKLNLRKNTGYVDLNSLKTDGLYYGYEFINAPINTVACVDVKTYSDTRVLQMFYAIGNNNKFKILARSFYGNNIWTKWQEILTENSQQILGMTGAPVRRYIQDPGQKSVNELWFDNLTQKPYKVLKTNSDTSVTTNFRAITNFDNSVGRIGVDQKWIDVTSSRAKDKLYVNNNRGPIMVSISEDKDGTVKIYVDDMAIILNETYNADVNNTFIVPKGSTYKFTGTSNIKSWYELVDA